MTKFYLVIFLFLIFLIGQDHLKCNGQRRNTEQLNIGVIFSIPYVLTAGLSIVLLFGVVAAPVSYFLGTPPRKYYPYEPSKWFEQKPKPNINGDIFKLTENSEDEEYYDYEDYEEMKSKSLDSQKFKGNRTKSFRSRSRLNFTKFESRSFSGSSSCRPGFVESAFLFLPKENEACKELLVCHAHGFIPYLPEKIIKLITFFTRKVGIVPKDFSDAIKIGLEDQGRCSQIYTDCHDDLQTIVQSTCKELFTSSLNLLNIKQEDLENQFSSILSSVLLSLE